MALLPDSRAATNFATAMPKFPSSAASTPLPASDLERVFTARAIAEHAVRELGLVLELRRAGLGLDAQGAENGLGDVSIERGRHVPIAIRRCAERPAVGVRERLQARFEGQFSLENEA